MTADNALPVVFGNEILLGAKIALIVFAILYFIFSLIVVRQVNLMTQTVKTETAPILKLISFVHALLALGVIILFVLFL